MKYLSKTIVREELKDVQLPDTTIDFIDVVIEGIFQTLKNEIQEKNIKRLTTEDVQRVLSEKRGITINIGNINYVGSEELENKITNSVINRILRRSFGDKGEEYIDNIMTDGEDDGQ